MSIDNNCSTKRGLPSAAAMTRSRAFAGSRVSPRRCSITSPLSASESGASSRSRSYRVDHSGRCSSRSGRVAQTSSIGASVAVRAMCSMRSRNADSAQWMSSKTTTTGCRAAIDSNSFRVPQKTSFRGKSPSSRPIAEAMRATTSSALLPATAASFDRASSGVSSS